MNSIHIISQDVFDKIRSRFSNLEMGDETGSVTSDPKKARFFDFDFVAENENLGRVSISINELGSLKIFYSQGILEDSDSFIKTVWYDFLREMRMFAKRRLLRFDTRDITKSNLDKNDFQYLAATGQKDETTMQESKMFGSSKSSYLPLEKTKLIVRHNKPVDETQLGARSRKHNIKALYIENQDGERFKYPFEHLAGAKAMQRHVANGGRPYDDVGKKIIEMSQHIAELAAFKRHVHGHDKMNYEVNEITEKADGKLQNLKQTMENLSKQGFYERWKESVQPFNDDEQMVLDQATMEDYKSKFTVKSFKEDLAQFFPLIHRIMQETGTIDLSDYVQEGGDKDSYCDSCDRPAKDCICDDVKEEAFNEFVSWANRVEEGRIEPDTLMSLKELVEGGLTLGVDGISAIEALQGIGIHDDVLENALVELSKVNSDADPVPTIKAWLTKEDPEAAEELGLKSDEPMTQEGDDESAMPEKEPSLREIAEMVKSFYDRETGKFPKGKTGVVVHIKKELGEKAGMLAEKLVDKLEPESISEGGAGLSVQQLATISDEALDKAYGYGRSSPGNTFGWQANIMSATYAKKMIDSGVTDIEKIADAIHKGWNVTAQKFVQNPDQFDDTEKLRQAGKLDAKLQQREKLMKINYAQLDNDEQEKDRVVARALLQAINGQQGVAEGDLNELFEPQQEYFKLADGQVIRVDFRQAGLNPDAMPGSIKINVVDPKIMPSSGMQIIQPWDKARENIRMAIQKWVQSGQGQQGMSEDMDRILKLSGLAK